METSPTRYQGNLWRMKRAAQKVGVGLPTLYKRLREKGLFLIVDGRNVPNDDLQKRQLFIVSETRFFVEAKGDYRYTQTVRATSTGMILLQETANELAQEKRNARSKRSRVSSSDNGDQGTSPVCSEHTQPSSTGSTNEEIRRHSTV